jgi:ABC-type glycerol-3-phosphate transport system substrate-binding protein
MRHAALALLAAAAALAACGKASSMAGADSKWADHVGNIPFVLGQEKGIQQAKATGRTPMYFFTATW